MAQSPAAMLAELERLQVKAPTGRIAVVVLRRDSVPGDPRASAAYLQTCLEWLERAEASGEFSVIMRIALDASILDTARRPVDPFARA